MKRKVGALLLLIVLLFSSCANQKGNDASGDDPDQMLSSEEPGNENNPGTGTAVFLDMSGASSANLYFSAMAKRGNQVAIAYEDKDCYIDVFDISSGERLYQRRLEDDVLSIVKSYLLGYDLKLQYNDGRIELFSIDSPKQTDTFYLPETLLSKVKVRDDDYRSYTTFDIDPTNEVYVVSDIDGLHVRANGKTTRIDKREITADILKSSYPVLSEHDAFSPRFGDVRIMNGGRTIAAVIYLPNSQIKENGILLYDIDSSELTWYANIVNPQTGQLKFVGDELILTNESAIDVSNKEIFELGTVNMVLSVTDDGEEFIVAEYESLGGETKGFRIYSNLWPDMTIYSNIHAPGPSYERIVAATENHLLLFGREGLRLVSY